MCTVTVTAARGFRASGVAAGLKSSGALDVALVVNDGPERTGAAVVTRNRFAAAPVQWTRQAVADGRLDAVLLNSGGANAATGAPGFADAHTSAEAVAAALGTSAADVALCSTGLIGTRLPMEVLLDGVRRAVKEL
ncbi:MAG TPA: bifunctional ornithine acetyltransferase/N-acetylglutamate synthase, partial [Mycobacteriales bacterium]|nr:bifunctional ornithine acetyltransferase/N-acetylglutamate synthase [Mycobacteriales bacterium]